MHFASEFRGSRCVSFQPVKELSIGRKASENAIIQGDNKLVLELLKLRYEKKVRCAYIDPPYNNQERYTHYDDTQDHDEWLEDVVMCAKQIKALLRDDGSLWISIDDRQVHYLKVALDEVFGRKSFVTTIVWQQRTTRENRKVFSNNHEYLLVYAADSEKFKDKRGLLDWDEGVRSRFKNPDNDAPDRGSQYRRTLRRVMRRKANSTALSLPMGESTSRRTGGAGSIHESA